MGARRKRGVLEAPCKLSKGSCSAEGGERKLQRSRRGTPREDSRGRRSQEHQITTETFDFMIRRLSVVLVRASLCPMVGTGARPVSVEEYVGDAEVRAVSVNSSFKKLGGKGQE